MRIVLTATSPLISRSIAKIASIYRTASTASGALYFLPGAALARSATTMNLRRSWLQQAASVIGRGLRLADVTAKSLHTVD
jgi:hypothetical protein